MTGGHGVNKEEVDGTVCSAVQCSARVVSFCLTARTWIHVTWNS